MSATRRLLTRDGYDQVSIEAIAREANVSRPTVYRRWPSKAHVVFDAVFDAADVGDVLDSSGEFEADLHRFVRGVFEFWRDPVVAAATMGILADRHRDPELQIRTQQLLDQQTRAAFGTLVRDGIAQRAVHPDLDVEMAYDVLVGTTFYIAHVLDPDGIDDAVDRLCALLLQGAVPRRKEQR
ncbi:putative HTH-type transcriptional regulator [Mycobacterium talmoniae]|uniref:Putative HTH-type transcriptional regulator n=1 Tax=Mycobacterium talmoniae TaxID=1858794 RepID=A0A2S8BCG2_9MYCO|nr:putative HTH-type transcriptional regulator [Mycobacterium talmoniae]